MTEAAASCGGLEYHLPDWVRVRRESFGLLFYDTRSTRLTFVRSGDDLDPPPFVGPRRTLAITTRDGVSPGLARLLKDLIAKGLVVAAQTE